jgi:hypothetical protein
MCHIFSSGAPHLGTNLVQTAAFLLAKIARREFSIDTVVRFSALAFAEYGRIAKTLHLLAVVDPVDDTYRRQMHKQLTVQESRHKLARDICHGKKGTIHQAYRDGMEDQLGSLGLVLNAAVLWTTRYIDAAVAQLRAEGHEIRDEDVTRLSPLKHKNLNVLGRYSFTASTPAGRCATRTPPGSTRSRRRQPARPARRPGQCRPEEIGGCYQ